MYRNVEQLLNEWKSRKNHLPLVLHGARQVGKTHSLRQFAGQAYESHVYVSLEVDSYIVEEINRDIRPQSIVQALSTYRGIPIVPGKTLIILDEIQNCERALTALKYFAEDMPDQDVVAAGSLLGVAMNRQKYSFPVGKVELVQMFPMDFEEVMIAFGKQDRVDTIRSAFANKKDIPSFVHEELLREYKSYQLYGGMPAVVQARLQKESENRVNSISSGIVNQYLADMTKYCGSSESVKIRMAYDSIPTQLAKENTKFQYALIKKGASSSYFGSAIDWLKASGTILMCRKISHGYYPPASQMDLSSFKIYMSDSGLLASRSGLTMAHYLGNLHMASGFRGGMAENAVACALAGNGHELFYWESDGKAEIDFVIAREGAAIPIEVKAAENTKSKSLQVYMGKYNPPYAIRLSGRNFGWSEKLWSVPIYASFLI